MLLGADAALLCPYALQPLLCALLGQFCAGEITRPRFCWFSYVLMLLRSQDPLIP